MKRIIALLLLFSLLLTGCLKSVTLNNRALVQAIGIDLINDKIQLTMQVFSPAINGTSLSATSDNAKIIQANGDSISGALANAVLIQGKELFIGHNRIIVIGSTLAKNGVIDVLNYFVQNAFSRQNVKLVIAQDNASDILKCKINQGILPAETLEKIVANSNFGMIENIQLYTFLAAFANNFDSITVPIMSIDKTKDIADDRELSTISTISLNGCALFSDGKMIDTLSTMQSQSLLFLKDKIKQTTIELNIDDLTKLSVLITSSKTDINLNHFNGDITFVANINSKAYLSEISPKLSPVNYIDKIETACEQNIKQNATAVFKKVINENNADVLNVADLLTRKEPILFEKLQTFYDMSNIKLVVNVDVDLDRLGL